MSSSDCTVLIAAPALLPTLTNGSFKDHAELLAFSDAEALRALEVISRRRPRLVAVERVFAATPRGAALINRIKADPTLSRSEVRVVSHEDEAVPGGVLSPAAVEAAPIATAASASAAPASVITRPAVAAPPVKAMPSEVAAPPAAAPAAMLDKTGTRRAPRFRLAANVEADINGNTATVIDLSTNGAQIVSSNVLRPNQRLRISLVDDDGAVRCNGVVAWASFEIPSSLAPRYRAGVQFVDAPAAAVQAFCLRHQE